MTQVYSQDTAYKQKLLGNPTNDILFRYLDSVGNGSGTKDMGTTVDEYFIKPPAGFIYVIDKLRIAVVDNAVLVPSGFGGAAALVTGCLMKLQAAGSEIVDILDLLDGTPLKNHGELSALGILEIQDGAASCFVQCEVDYARDGAPLRLDGDRDERIMFKVQDDLSGYVSVYVSVTGRVFKDLK